MFHIGQDDLPLFHPPTQGLRQVHLMRPVGGEPNPKDHGDGQRDDKRGGIVESGDGGVHHEGDKKESGTARFHEADAECHGHNGDRKGGGGRRRGRALADQHHHGHED